MGFKKHSHAHNAITFVLKTRKPPYLKGFLSHIPETCREMATEHQPEQNDSRKQLQECMHARYLEKDWQTGV